MGIISHSQGSPLSSRILSGVQYLKSLFKHSVAWSHQLTVSKYLIFNLYSPPLQLSEYQSFHFPFLFLLGSGTHFLPPFSVLVWVPDPILYTGSFHIQSIRSRDILKSYYWSHYFLYSWFHSMSDLICIVLPFCFCISLHYFVSLSLRECQKPYLLCIFVSRVHSRMRQNTADETM